MDYSQTTTDSSQPITMDAPTTNPTPRWAASRLIKTKRSEFPEELVDDILDYIYPRAKPAKMPKAPPEQTTSGRLLAFMPPANGACPFMQLPTELRRDIFAESLPSKDVLIHPKCDDDKISEVKAEKSKRWARRNRASDLMIINKKISGEVAEAVYQERTFVVHVHEGLKNGGIEFLHTGRQPLQYQDNVADGRFWKFSEVENDFGFRRLKKTHVQIFPSEEKNCKHSAINTYFMNLALVRLLERSGGEKNDIYSLTIEFMQSTATNDRQGRLAIQRAEQYWWDPDKKRPRESSVHGLPNIELVLRPFANLTACHQVNIELPHSVAFHPRIAAFVQDLKASMTSRGRFSTIFADDDLEMKIESARWAMEDYVNFTLHGTRHHKVDNLREDEVHEPGLDAMDLDSDGEEGAVPGSKTKRAQIKRDLSPASQSTSPGSESKKSRTNEKIVEWQAFAANGGNHRREPSPSYCTLEDDEALARALDESYQMVDGSPVDDAENRQLQAAIAASMADEEARKTADEEAREMADKRSKWALKARQQTGPLKTSNRFQMLSTVSDGADPVFVGQGCILRERTNDAWPPSYGQSDFNHGMAVDATPWSVGPALKSFYKVKTNINVNGSAPPILNMQSASMSEWSAPLTPTPAHSSASSGEPEPKMSNGSPPTKETSQLAISGLQTRASPAEKAGNWREMTPSALHALEARVQKREPDSDEIDAGKS